jgi:hypothetical protein
MPEFESKLAQATQAWSEWCQALEKTGAATLKNVLTHDDIDLAEGLRYLGRSSHYAMFGEIDNVDSKHPYFWPFLDPHTKIGGDNPQGLYLSAPINPTDTFVVRGKRGSVRWFSAVVMRSIAAQIARQQPIGNQLYLPNLQFDADGNFEIVIAPDERPGNWLQSDKWAAYILVRQFFPTPDDVTTMELSIENVTVGDTTPAPLDLEFAINAVSRAAKKFSGMVPHLHSELISKEAAKNSFKTDIGDPTSGGGVPGGNAVTARWRVEPHEALIIKVTPPTPCAYWDVQVGNGWYETHNYRHHISGLTCEGAQVADDGTVLLVLTEQDPGTANWLETAHHREGHIAIRWQMTEGRLPIPELTVVDAATIRENTGLPLVSPEERAEQRRALRASFEGRFRHW